MDVINQNSFFSRFTRISEEQSILRFDPFSFSNSDNPVLQVTIQSPAANWEDVSALLDSEVFYNISVDKVELTNWDWDKTTIITGDYIDVQYVPYDRQDLLHTINGLIKSYENQTQERIKSERLLRELKSFIKQLKDRATARADISSDQARLQRANLKTINKVMNKLSQPE